MAEHIRAYDWGSTPLGLIEDWPESLLCSVNLMLACAFPSLIFWGKELIQFYNDAFIPLLAERHPAGLGQAAERCWADAWQIVGPNLNQVVENGETIYQENAIVPIIRGGHLQDVRWTYNYSPIFAVGDDPVGVFVVCQDTTREVYAVHGLQESEARASRVLQSIGDAVIVTDTETRIIQMNPVAEYLTGWRLQEAQGRPVKEIFHILDESTSQPAENPAEKVRRTRSVVGLGSRTALVAKDGRKSAIDDSGAPIFDDNGELTGIVLVFRNIEERRTAEREKERLTEQLHQVLTATSDAIVSFDRNWTITYLNARAKALFSSGRELLGRNLWEEFPDAAYQGSPVVEHYHRAMDEGISGNFETFYPQPLDLWLHIDVHPTSEGIVVYCRDTTAEVAAKKALKEKSEQAERQLAEIETVYRTAPIG
ncbi:MAG TPA: PAS domain-containing protein, partial [Edaphobacter sp.]|nr:PAS domain-containing protein [Edaphobacter sp.]